MREIPYDEVRSALGLWLPYVVVAGICLAAGLSAIALSLLRARDRLLFCVGIFSTLYALRLFWENDLVRNAFGEPRFYAPVPIITWLIPIPTALFFYELIGPGWRSSIRIWVWMEVVFAPVAMVAGPHYPGTTDRVNNALIIAGVLLILAHGFARTSRESVPRVLQYCILIFAVFVLFTNLHWRPAGRNLEPFGFLILIAGLAWTAAQRAILRDQKFTAVQSELATARRIQTSILPRALPESGSIRLAARYRPMTEVAGDFYDFLRLDDSRVTILVADVSGHGVPAALIASMLKVAFAQQGANASDPASILAELNRILNGVLDGQFVTASCAHIDLNAHTVTYAGAGHPPALLLRRGQNEIVELLENGFFLGPFRNASYANVTAAFVRGDRLLLYTDGILEATFTDGEPFGPERLREFLAGQNGAEPAVLADALMTKVSIGAQEDDLTVVVAEAR